MPASAGMTLPVIAGRGVVVAVSSFSRPLPACGAVATLRRYQKKDMVMI